MEVKCSKCGKDYNIKDDFIKKADLKMRCRGCGEVIIVKKLSAQPDLPLPPPGPARGASEEKADGAMLPTPISQDGGVDEFDFDSGSKSVPPLAGKKPDVGTVMGMAVPPPPELVPHKPELVPHKEVGDVEEPFSDLPVLKPEAATAADKKDYEFDKVPAGPAAPLAPGLPQLKSEPDSMDFNLDLPPPGRADSAPDLPTLKAMTAKKKTEHEFSLPSMTEAKKPPPPPPGGGTDLPVLKTASKAKPTEHEFKLDLPGLGDSSEMEDLPGPKKVPKKTEHEFSLDLPPPPDPGGGAGFGQLGDEDLPKAKHKPKKTEQEFNLDLPPPPPGKGGTRKMPAHATSAFRGDIPAVLSPSPEPSVPAKKSDGKGLDEPFGTLDIPSKKAVDDLVDESRPSGGEEDLFGSLSAPPGELGDEADLGEDGFGEAALPTGEEGEKFIGERGGIKFGEIDLGEAPDLPKSAQVEEVRKPHSFMPGEADLGEDAFVDIDKTAAREMEDKRMAARQSMVAAEEAPAAWKVVARGKTLVALIIAAAIIAAGVVIWQTETYVVVYKVFSKYVLGEDIDAYYTSRDSAIADVSRKIQDDDYKAYDKGIEKLRGLAQSHPKDKYLLAYTSYLMSLKQIRFGRDQAMEQKVDALLNQVPAENEFQTTYVMATSSQKLARRIESAKIVASLAVQHLRFPKDKDLLSLAALGALSIGDGQQALELYKKLASLENNSRRSMFGLIRASFHAGDNEAGDELLSKFIEENPDFIEAQILKADRYVQVGAISQASTLIEKIKSEDKEKIDAFMDIPIKTVVGMIHLKKDEYTESKKIFVEMLAAESMNIDALIGMGNIDLYEGNSAKALGRFNLVLGVEPLHVEGTFGVILSHIQLSEFKEAREVLTSVAERFKEDYRWYFSSAKLSAALGKHDEAEKLFRTAVEKNPANLESYLEMAELYYKQDRNLDAIAVLEEAKSKLPLTAKLLTAFARGRINRGEYNKAYEDLSRAIKKDPEYVHSLYLMGITLYNLKSYEEASTFLNKVSKRNSAYPGLVLYQGLIFEALGETEKALEYYTEALAATPDDEDIMMRTTAIYVTYGKFDDAEILLNRVLDKNPTHGGAVFYLGRVYMGKHKYAEGLHHFIRTLKISPSVGLYYLWAGLASEKMGNFSDTLKYSEKALEMDENLAEAFLLRGKIRTRMGMIKDARRDLKKAMELKPGLMEAWGSLGIVFEEERNFSEAMKAYTKYLEHFPDDFEIHSRYGLILYDKGMLGEAKDHFSSAIVVAKDYSPFSKWRFTSLYYLGLIEEKTGNKQKAIKYYEEYAAEAPDDAIDRDVVQQRLLALKPPAD